MVLQRLDVRRLRKEAKVDLREGLLELHDLLHDWEEAAGRTNAVFAAWIEAGMFAWEADKPELARQSQIHYLNRVAQSLGFDQGAFGHPLSGEKRGRKSGKWTELPRLLEVYAPELVDDFKATLAYRTASLAVERPRMYAFGVAEFDDMRTAVQQSHSGDQLEKANQLKGHLAQSADDIRRARTDLADYIRTTFPLA